MIKKMGIGAKKKKVSEGRKKIEIKRIQGVNSRQVTFILTGSQIVILVNSPGGRVYSFGQPSADALIDRYLATTTATATGSTSDGASTSSSQSQKPLMVKEFNQHYLEFSKELEMEKQKKVVQNSKSGSGLAWYDEPVDDLDVEELPEYLTALGELKRKVLLRADELSMIQKAQVGFNFRPAMN